MKRIRIAIIAGPATSAACAPTLSRMIYMKMGTTSVAFAAAVGEGARLGWKPTGPDLLTYLRNMDYSES